MSNFNEFKPKLAGRQVCLVLAMALFALLVPDTGWAHSSEAQDQAPAVVTTIKEGNDFATRVVGEPWDMSQFSDVSASLNNAGRNNFLTNIQVSGGKFSATSTTANSAQFYAFFPGYEFTMRIGKVGEQFPIPSSYHCLYVRMSVVSPSMSDRWYVNWLNYKQDLTDGGDQSYPAYLQSDGLPLGSWRIYSMDLNTVNSWYHHAWSSQSSWKGLAIHPSEGQNTSFSVDWIRLTDCQPVNYTISWTPVAGQTRLWAGIGNQQKDILIANVTSNDGGYRWDVQGIAPGTYYIGVEANGRTDWLKDTLVIEQAPIAQFLRPSPYSGNDYATAAGQPWHMNSGSEVNVSCATASHAGGILSVDTGYPGIVPAACKGPGVGEADPKMFLTAPSVPFNGAQYRYLSFRMSINGDIPEPADGMIGRWIWTTAGCTMVSQGIPYDIGWQTYAVDLLDAVQGMPEEGNCTKQPWSSASQVTALRFDPNENWTGNLVPTLTFHQEFDWIRLSQVDRVTRGTPLPIHVSFNKSPDQIPNRTFYYTTNRQQPTQNLASAYTGSVPSRLPSIKVFLPYVANVADSTPPPPNAVTFTWNTGAVPAGQYYICVVSNDGYNETTFCSAAPIVVQ